VLSTTTPSPPGISFLDVPLPRQQPNMPDPGSLPARLPDAVTMPSLDAIELPDESLLRQLALEE